MQRKVIYVTDSRATVHRSKGMLTVSVDGKRLDRWAVEDVERVVLVGNVQITTQALAILLAAGVHVGLMSGNGRFRGQLVSPESGNVFVRLAQHARHGDPAFRLAFARELVDAKVANTRQLILRHRRNHPASEAVLTPLLAQIDALQPELSATNDLDQLRGFEGAAAAAWFQAFGTMVRTPFLFERRSQRPAHNEVNALLNLGYTLLTFEIAGRLEAVGFDPRVGFYHGIRYGRSSLALDLIEPHRVEVIDRLVLSSLNRRMFSPSDFHDVGPAKGVRLLPKALRRFLALYEERLGAVGEPDSPRAAIDTQIAALRKRVLLGSTPPADAPTEGDTP